ncbi:hypothetical protein DQ384_27125 [Sphaerisporangium album]|uniref:Uncharacterized protein n=1 Tax=Sphaerisporangium album TaxID=509200 RepID=A0A367FCQ9_9ACTN|nr:hypothetical protein DQ384_27125 [Sphaerisporangium album]
MPGAPTCALGYYWTGFKCASREGEESGKKRRRDIESRGESRGEGRGEGRYERRYEDRYDRRDRDRYNEYRYYERSTYYERGDRGRGGGRD